jgi:predicted RNA-binding protein YlxR (DUF448 family)/ribosomal protein L30E
MCAVTRQVMPIDELIRFVVAPDGAVVPDLKRKLPGRGLWIAAERARLVEAVRKGVFNRGFRREVRLGEDFVAATERLLVRAAVEALAIAGKAGEVVAGFTKTEAALAAGEAVAVLQASDGAADGRRKLEAAARRAAVPVLAPLTSAELDLALRRTNVIHAALRAGSAAQTVLSRCESIARFREPQPGLPDRREAARPAAASPEDAGPAVPEAPAAAISASGSDDTGPDHENGA